MEKKFYQVRLSEKCNVKSKMVNGVLLTKNWQMKVGEIGDFAKFPDVEAQAMVKKGNRFEPAEEAAGGAAKGSEGASGLPSGSASTPAQDAEEAQAMETNVDSDLPPDFSNMTVEQLKNYLIAKGIAQSELRNTIKSDLIEQAEFIWSQN